MLVVAGSLKRGDPDRPEDQVLMRALRDFNVPKIVTDDMPVFMGLIGDLFPALDVPRKRDMDFEKFVKQSVLDLKLQAEDNFVLKVNLDTNPVRGSLILERHEGCVIFMHCRITGCHLEAFSTNRILKCGLKILKNLSNKISLELCLHLIVI